MTGLCRREVVLVCGPQRSGVSGVAVALRRRRPDLEVVDSEGLVVGQAPVAVVFVVSAAAQLTGSDCALLDAAAAHTDTVVAVLSKTDAHRNWRDTLVADRAGLSAHRARYRHTPWAGVAAAPPVGPPRIDGLLDALDAVLAAPDRDTRNTLRSREFQIISDIRRYQRAAEAPQLRERIAQLRAERADVLDHPRREFAQRSGQLRGRLRDAGFELAYLVAARTASVRSELQEACAGLSRAGVPAFAARAGQRIAAMADEIAGACGRHVADIAADFGLDEPAPVAADIPVPDSAPVPTARLENRLMMLLGVGFGLGFAVTLGRLFDAVSSGPGRLGAVLCAALGVVLAGWIVSARRLLAHRVAHDRWVGEVLGRLRPALERHIAARLSDAERMWAAAEAERAGGVAARTAGPLAAIDTELAELVQAQKRVAADRDRALPRLRRALEDVRVALHPRYVEGSTTDLNR